MMSSLISPSGKLLGTAAIDHLQRINDHANGHDTFPLNSWSLTITKSKDDVPAQILEIMDNFVKLYCAKGAVATEVGPRAHHYHIQGLLSLRYPTTIPYKKSLSKIFLALFLFFDVF